MSDKTQVCCLCGKPATADDPTTGESRGDKTAIELFISGVRGREAGLRRRLEDGKSMIN